MGSKGSDRGYIVVTPEALGSPHNWNWRSAPDRADDFGFVLALVDDLRQRQSDLADRGAGGDDRSIERHRERPAPGIAMPVRVAQRLERRLAVVRAIRYRQRRHVRARIASDRSGRNLEQEDPEEEPGLQQE